MIVIIGGGVAGLAAAVALQDKGEDVIVFEKQERAGGLCKSFQIGSEWYDLGVHCSFTKDVSVREIFEEKVGYNSSKVAPLNYKKGRWIKHPVQTNIYPLDTEEKICIIRDFIDRPQFEKVINYEQWLQMQYGKYFTEKYPTLYTEKYWTVHPRELETKWVGSRMYSPKMEEVLYGAFESETSDVYYANNVRYPKEGGYEKFLHGMEGKVHVECNKEMQKISVKEKQITFSDGEKYCYDKLIVTAPLPEVINAIENVPQEIRDHASRLNYTSLILVSLYIKGKLKKEISHIYIYMIKNY